MFSVSEIVKSKTRKCVHGFSCLTAGHCGNQAQCKVLSDFDQNMLVVKPQKSIEMSCSYKMSISTHGHMCTCPTHYAVHMKKKRLDSYTK